MQQPPLFDASQQSSSSAEEVPTRVYSVSELNAELRFLLESTYMRPIWVEGEVSNFSQPTHTGHFYFSLKDDKAILKAVMWKTNHRTMKWRPKDGMKVMVQGRMSLYEPGGVYQISVTQIVPRGKGDLFAAFEQLKEKLQAEGLFDPKRKRPIPLLPKKIGIITSRTGAVIRDMLNILNRRYANLHILLFPAIVQGEEAAPSLIEGLHTLNRSKTIDVLILARGGGSIEDLWPFNEERVARAIAASRIPVISAVGHETDTTIADFVADLRAPTPSAAAELVVGQKSELNEKIVNLSKRVDRAFHGCLLAYKNKVQFWTTHRALAGIPQRIQHRRQTLDELTARLRDGLGKHHRIQLRRLQSVRQRVHAGQLRHLIEVKRARNIDCVSRIERRLRAILHSSKAQFGRMAGMLDSLSPLAVLERGYSIACKEDGTILKDSSQVATGEDIGLRLYGGKLKCVVKEIEK
jgi:exodeoxyribonuclease VII large subunit